MGAMICNFCYNATEPNLGLTLSADHTTFKCYMGDTGLLVSHAFDENELASFLSEPFIFHAGDVKESKGIKCLPLYMISCL